MNLVILLATYNGAKYIEMQLNSLLSQTVRPDHVYIRDDGSSDSTLAVIAAFDQLHPGFLTVMEDHYLHRGAKDSFMWLLEKVQADYYMFCDQDDVWLPFKIEHTLAKMKEVEKKNPGLPVMIHTDLTLVDANLMPIYESFWKWRKFHVDLNRKFNYAALGNVFTGCTMMINHEAKQVSFPMSVHAHMHDEWIGLMVAKHGVVDNVKEQTILYRQHGTNVCAIGQKTRKAMFFLRWLTVPRWYLSQKEMLQEIGYGSLLKFIYYKFLYVSKRFFKIYK